MFQFLFCYVLERKDKKWFKRDIIVLISFLILFVSISFLVNIGKEMSLPGFRIDLEISSRRDTMRQTEVLKICLFKRNPFFNRNYAGTFDVFCGMFSNRFKG